MKTYLLPEGGNRYKVNLHTHSILSDGELTPEELKACYKAKGYSAVAFTDHRVCVPHTELTDDDFIALTGIELDFSAKDASGRWAHTTHVCGVARDPNAGADYPDAPLPLSYESVNAEIQKLNAAGFITTVNHPVWSDMSTEDVLCLHDMHSIEVFNSVGTYLDNYSDDSSYYEHFLRAGGRAMPIAADDCHTSAGRGVPGVEYFQGFNMICAPELTYDALIAGIDAGHMYASTGPEFKTLWLEDGVLHVECSPVMGVYVHGCRYSQRTYVLCADGTGTCVDIDVSRLCRESDYIWVQLRDSQGGKAWSVPHWFN